VGDGVIVPTDKLNSTAEVLKGLSTSADQIAAGLKDADPPGVLWGALGALLSIPYQAKADEAREHIRMIATALSSQDGAIRATADRYRELDKALEQAFQRFQDTLSGDR
jgi:uncharacterized protein YukE